MCLSWHSCLESAKGKYSFFPKRFKGILGTRPLRVPIGLAFARHPWGHAARPVSAGVPPTRERARLAARPAAGYATTRRRAAPPASPPHAVAPGTRRDPPRRPARDRSTGRPADPPTRPSGPHCGSPRRPADLQNLTSGALPGDRVRICMTFMPVMARSGDLSSSVRICMTTARGLTRSALPTTRPVRPAKHRPADPPPHQARHRQARPPGLRLHAAAAGAAQSGRGRPLGDARWVAPGGDPVDAVVQRHLDELPAARVAQRDRD